MSARSRSAFVVAFLSCSFCAPAISQTPRALDLRWDATRVHFDLSQGPTIWALGATYKAGFGPEGAQYVPFLGSSAPRDYPIRFLLRELHAGDCEVELANDVSPRLEGSTVVLDRGAVVELYRLEPDSMEQLFRFDAPPRAGELVLRIDVETELEPQQDADGLRFAGEHGGAHYGKAVAFDERGFAAEAPAAWRDGGLEIRVPASFLERSRGAVTVDPLVTTFPVDVGPANDRRPSVAYDASLDLYLVCWERTFSALDLDIVGRILDGAGNLVRDVVIEAGTTRHSSPRIAGIDALDRFLVATVQAYTDTHGWLVGHVVDLAGGGTVVGPPVQWTTWPNRTVEAAGDAGTSPPYRFCVVGEAWFGGFALVTVLVIDEDGQPTASFLLEPSAEDLSQTPHVARTAGLSPNGLRGWPIAYLELGGNAGAPTYYIDFDGGYTAGPSLVADETTVTIEGIASQLDAATGTLTHLAVWTDHDANDTVRASAVRGAVAGAPFTIRASPSPQYADFSADSDGASFAVCYVERTVPGVDEPVFVEIFDLQGIYVSRTERIRLSLPGGVHGWTALASTRSGGGGFGRFLAVWHDQAGGPDGQIEGALFDTPGPGVRYCTAAPNSVGSGATIHASGSTSIGLDLLELSAVGCPPNRPGLFYLGRNPIEQPFGEGFRCIGGATRRIEPVVVTDGSGTASVSLDFDLPYGEIVEPGAVTNYQFWYRDPAGGPSHFNLTDALLMVHLP